MDLVFISLDDNVNRNDVFNYVNDIKRDDKISFEGDTGQYAVIALKSQDYKDDIRERFKDNYTDKTPYELRDLHLMYQDIDKKHDCIHYDIDDRKFVLDTSTMMK